jgi:hypothetical protein
MSSAKDRMKRSGHLTYLYTQALLDWMSWLACNLCGRWSEVWKYRYMYLFSGSIELTKLSRCNTRGRQRRRCLTVFHHSMHTSHSCVIVLRRALPFLSKVPFHGISGSVLLPSVSSFSTLDDWRSTRRLRAADKLITQPYQYFGCPNLCSCIM